MRSATFRGDEVAVLELMMLSSSSSLDPAEVDCVLRNIHGFFLSIPRTFVEEGFPPKVTASGRTGRAALHSPRKQGFTSSAGSEEEAPQGEPPCWGAGLEQDRVLVTFPGPHWTLQRDHRDHEDQPPWMGGHGLGPLWHSAVSNPSPEPSKRRGNKSSLITTLLQHLVPKNNRSNYVSHLSLTLAFT